VQTHHVAFHVKDLVGNCIIFFYWNINPM